MKQKFFNIILLFSFFLFFSLAQNSGDIQSSISVGCSQNCQSCYRRNGSCYNCSSGYTLTSAGECSTQSSFNFVFVLNYQYSQFTSQTTTFKEGLASYVKEDSYTLSQKVNNIVFSNIISGSVIVSGTVYSTSSSNMQATLSNFQSIGSGSLIAGIPVLSTSFTSSSGTTINATTSMNASSTTSLGLIIGVSVGGFIALIVLCVIIYCCCIKKKQVEQIQEEKQKKTSSTAALQDANAMISENQFRLNNNSESNSKQIKYLSPDNFL